MLWSSSPTTVTLPCGSGQEAHQLPLCVVGVLELVDQDVAVSRSLLLEHGGVIAQEPQREGHLVAEVEPVSRAHEPLVGVVRRRQLGMPGGLLAQRLVSRRVGRASCQIGGGGEIRRRSDVLVAQAADERHQRQTGIASDRQAGGSGRGAARTGARAGG